jgi:hypothetical protein
VITGRDVLPIAGGWVVDEITVVNGIGVLIHKKPGLGRLGNAGLFEILNVLGKEIVEILRGSVSAAAESAENRVHRNAANTGAPTGGGLHSAEVRIRRALINAGFARKVIPEHALVDPGEIRVAPIFH